MASSRPKESGTGRYSALPQTPLVSLYTTDRYNGQHAASSRVLHQFAGRVEQSVDTFAQNRNIVERRESKTSFLPHSQQTKQPQ